MKFHILFACMLLASCSSTKVITYSALSRVVKGEAILMMPVRGMSENQSYALLESAKQSLSETNQVTYLIDHEYQLLQKGVPREALHKGELNDSLMMVVARECGSRYIIETELLNVKERTGLGSYTALELNEYNEHFYDEEETNSAILLFRVLDTKSYLTESRFQVTTKISPLTIDEGDGETRINVTSGATAIRKAFQKGIRKVKKDMISASDSY